MSDEPPRHEVLPAVRADGLPASGWERNRWMIPGFVPFLSFLSPLYAGVRMRDKVWTVIGAVLLVIVVLAFAVDSDENDAGGVLLVLDWLGGIAATLIARPAYDRFRAPDQGRLALQEARGRIAQREEARRLAAKEPELARELGVGRPDRPGAQHGGVIDVNAVNAATLQDLPGIDQDAAEKIVSVRGELGPYSSLEELATLCDLRPDVLEELRPFAVILGR